jgi:hypothetical protein
MRIRARVSMSADGYVTTPDGWPALTADPAFVSGKSHGIQEFRRSCETALMSHTTFEPAVTNDRWAAVWRSSMAVKAIAIRLPSRPVKDETRPSTHRPLVIPTRGAPCR